MNDSTVMLKAGQIVKINGLPYELLDDVEAIGPEISEGENETGQNGE